MAAEEEPRTTVPAVAVSRASTAVVLFKFEGWDGGTVPLFVLMVIFTPDGTYLDQSNGACPPGWAPEAGEEGEGAGEDEIVVALLVLVVTLTPGGTYLDQSKPPVEEEEGEEDEEGEAPPTPAPPPVPAPPTPPGTYFCQSKGAVVFSAAVVPLLSMAVEEGEAEASVVVVVVVLVVVVVVVVDLGLALSSAWWWCLWW